MFCFIFEVLPGAGRKEEYLNLVEYLKPTLETMDGYVGSERFESCLRSGWMLSLQTWRDEKSVVRWRTEAEHHAIQVRGRFETFADYHIRGGDVTSDTDPPTEAPIHQLRFDETEIGKGKLVTFTEMAPARGVSLSPAGLPSRLGLAIHDGGLIGHDIYESIYNPGKMALLVAWRDANAADRWVPRTMADGISSLRHRKIRVIRDYGRFDRREAPQFYPDVEGRPNLHATSARRS